MHSLNIIHRDIKPGNILVEVRHGPEAEKFNPVIIDFGFVNHRFCSTGTRGYVPPEAFDESQATKSLAPLKKFDIYALGAVLYEVKFRSNLPCSNRAPKEFM